MKSGRGSGDEVWEKEMRMTNDEDIENSGGGWEKCMRISENNEKKRKCGD